MQNNAMLYVAFALAQRLLAEMVNRGVLSPEDARKLLIETAQANATGGPSNIAAKELLEKMAATYDLRGKPKH